MDIKFDFDDVLIRPKRSTISSRQKVDLQKFYKFKHSQMTWKGIPIIIANMDTTGTFAMTKSLAPTGVMVALHKYYDWTIQNLSNFNLDCNWYTLGIQQKDYNKLINLSFKPNPNFICIDVANGYLQNFVEYVKKVRFKFPKSTIMAGNVATPEMVQELLIAGEADIIKIGCGSGSVCQTREITGVGYPQLSAIMECADAAHGLNGHICADGGCKTPGDIVKAFGAGADFVMIGGMLAGTDECEGDWQWVGGKKYKYSECFQEGIPTGYTGSGCEIITTKNKELDGIWKEQQQKHKLRFYGMASQEALDKYHNGDSDYRASEGKCTEVSYKGPAKDVMKEILGGLRSACTYVGAKDLKDLPKCTTFIKLG